MKIFDLPTNFGTVEKVYLQTGRYPVKVPGNFINPIYISLVCEDGEPWSTLTTNVGLPGCMDDTLTAIDVNNNGIEGLNFLVNNGLAVKTGRVVSSGWCNYPVVKIDIEKLKEVSEWRE